MKSVSWNSKCTYSTCWIINFLTNMCVKLIFEVMRLYLVYFVSFCIIKKWWYRFHTDFTQGSHEYRTMFLTSFCRPLQMSSSIQFRLSDSWTRDMFNITAEVTGVPIPRNVNFASATKFDLLAQNAAAWSVMTARTYIHRRSITML